MLLKSSPRKGTSLACPLSEGINRIVQKCIPRTVASASWNVPTISEREASLLGESTMTCNEGYHRTATLEDVLDIDGKHVLKR